MTTKIKAALVAAAALTVIALAGCSGDSTAAPPPAAQVQADESAGINNTLLVLKKAERQSAPTDSANLHIQNAWYTAEGDPHKIWYGELLSANGALIEPYVTQGPAVDASDQVTNPFQPVWNTDDDGQSGSIAGVAIGLAEPDGTYDDNSPELLAITASGAIVRIWVGNGIYIQSDQPFRTTQTPLLTENTSVAPSPTNTSLTKHPFVPTAVRVPR
jgi:hypothetical protein